MAATKKIAEQKGQEKTFDELVQENYAAALQRAKRFIKEKEVAKDMVQEALIQAFLNIDKLKDKKAFRPWLLGIVRNTCFNHLRSQKIHYIHLKEELGELAEETEIKVPKELLDQLQKAIKKLKDKDRKIIEEYYYQGYSIQEISKFTDLSIANVKVRLHRARKALEKILGTRMHRTRMLWTQGTPLAMAA